MITICDDLRKSILQAAIQGKLTKQLPEDGNAEELYKQIQEEKQRLIKEGKIKKEKSLPEITEDDMPFEIPENWKWVKLSDIAFITKLAGFEYTQYIAPNISSSGIPLIKGKNIQDGKLVINFESFIPEKISNELERSKIRRKCLLTPYVGTIGNIAIFNEDFPAHLGSNVGKIEIYGSSVIEEYVYYFLQSDIGYKELTKHKKATAQESISIEAIRDVYIPIMPILEQKRIVTKIDELMSLIDKMEKTEKAITKLYDEFPNDMKSSLLQAAIQGKLTEQLPEDGNAEDLYEKIKAEKQRLIKEGKIKKDKNESYIFRRDNSHYEKQGNIESCINDEFPFEIPDNWKWVRLKDIVFNNGQITPCEPFSYIDIGSIDNIHHKLNDMENIIEPDKAPSRARKIVAKGDIIYSTVRPYLHNMCIIDRDFTHTPIASTGFAVMSCFEGIHNRYLFYFLLSPDFDAYANSTENAKGVAYPAINDTKLYQALVPLPPLEEQKRIVTKLNQLLSSCDSLSEIEEHQG